MAAIVKETETQPEPARRIRPFFRDLSLTAATEFTALLAALLLVSLFGRLLGAVALGEYLLLRRLVSWLQGGVQLGLGTALTRYVAYAADSNDGRQETYLLITAGISVSVVALLGMIFALFRPTFGRLFFGKNELQSLIVPLTIILLGSTMHAAVYGYYRGRLFMRLANGVQFCNLAAAPFISVALFWKSHSVAAIVSCIGVLMCICSFCFAIPIFFGRTKGADLLLGKRVREMLHYGLPRFVGDLALGGLMALPPILASHYIPMGRVVYLLLGASILTAFSTSFTPLGIILLSKASMMLTQGRVDDLRDQLDYLVAAVLELSVFGCLQFMVFTDVILRVWVGHFFIESTLVVRLLLVAVPFYVLYVALRSVVDAASITAYNSRNLLMVFVALLAAIFLIIRFVPESHVLESVAVAWVGALVCLGCLTARTLHKLLRISVNYLHMVPIFMISLVLAGASLLIHWMNGFQTGPTVILLVELVEGVVFLACLGQLGPWLPYVWRALSEGRIVSSLFLSES